MSLPAEVRVPGLVNVHTHLREGPISPHLVKHCLAGGAVVLGAMPNTEKGLRSEVQVTEYLKTIENGVVECAAADPLYFPSWHKSKRVEIFSYLMLTEETTHYDIAECAAKEIFRAKVYPLNRTTNSRNGVARYGALLEAVHWCGEHKTRAHFHPEHPNMGFENRDAEFAFLPIVEMYLQETQADIVWEHGTDARCIPFWKQFARDYPDRFFVTLTAHHLLANETAELGNNASVCKPTIKTARDAVDLVRFVAEDHDWVMAGGDDAFHDISKKHPDAGGCACGAYTAPFLLPLYAHALEHLLVDERGRRIFIRFTSSNARAFHGLTTTEDSSSSDIWVTLVRQDMEIPKRYIVGDKVALPFWGGKTIRYRIKEG